MGLQGIKRHRCQRRIQRGITSPAHHQIGIVARGIPAGRVNEQHVGRVRLTLQRIEILKETRPFPGQVESRGKRGQPLPQALCIGLAGAPVGCIGRWVSEKDKADQQLEAGDIQIGARPVGKDDARLGNLVGADDAGAIIRTAHRNP